MIQTLVAGKTKRTVTVVHFSTAEVAEQVYRLNVSHRREIVGFIGNSVHVKRELGRTRLRLLLGARGQRFAVNTGFIEKRIISIVICKLRAQSSLNVPSFWKNENVVSCGQTSEFALTAF